MATSLPARAILYGDGVPTPGQDLRLGISAQMTALGTPGSSGLASRPGVRRTGVGSPLAVTAGSGMAVAVAVGQCYIPAPTDSGGQYLMTLDTGGSLTLAAADPSNPRVDLIVAQVVDVGSSSTTYAVVPITGTPGASPPAPATPTTSIALAQVLIPAGSTSITSGQITDLRQWTVALGGIVPVANSAAYPANGASDYMHNIATGRLLRYVAGVGAGAPRVASFAPVTTTVSGSVACSTGGTTIASVTVTVDGQSEVEIRATWAGIHMATPVVDAQLTHAILLDGSPVDGWFFAMPTGIGSNIATLGGSHSTYLSTAQMTAGSHTITWTGTVSGTANAILVTAHAGQLTTLRAQATLQ